MKVIYYSKCIQSFIECYLSNKQITSKYVKKISKIRPFDVTLRDGLQGLDSDEAKIYNIDFKQKVYGEIMKNYNPKNIEIGSCVNTKIFPIFKETKELFDCIKDKDNSNKYILVPNEKQLINAIKFGATNFSFITSISNSFQLKNTKMTKEQNLNNLNNMIHYLDNYIENTKSIGGYKKFNIKLYVSCINECPIDGKISINNIIEDLHNLSINKFDKICLSDTCGSLTHIEFVDIIDKLYKIGININKFTLHLHVKPEREDEVEKIVHTAIDYGIEEFDVSDLNTGGCCITIDKNNLLPNMSYEQYYKYLITYLNK